MIDGMTAANKAAAASESRKSDYKNIKASSKFSGTASGMPASAASRRRYHRNLLGAGMVPEEDIAFDEAAFKKSRLKSMKEAADKASEATWTFSE